MTRLQPLVAERVRSGAAWDLPGFLDEAAAQVGAMADPADAVLVGQMLDQAARPEDPVPGEFAELYTSCLRGGGLELARVQMALFGAVVIATWRARPAGD